MTHDLDILVSTEPTHAEATYRGLLAFDARIGGVFGADALMVRNRRVPIHSQRGHEADILTSVGDMQFDDLYGRRHEAAVGDLTVSHACAADQLAMKEVSAQSVRRDIESGTLPPEQLAAARRVLQRDEEDIAILQSLVNANL